MMRLHRVVGLAAIASLCIFSSTAVHLDETSTDEEDIAEDIASLLEEPTVEEESKYEIPEGIQVEWADMVLPGKKRPKVKGLAKRAQKHLRKILPASIAGEADISTISRAIGRPDAPVLFTFGHGFGSHQLDGLFSADIGRLEQDFEADCEQEANSPYCLGNLVRTVTYDGRWFGKSAKVFREKKSANDPHDFSFSANFDWQSFDMHADNLAVDMMSASNLWAEKSEAPKPVQHIQGGLSVNAIAAVKLAMQHPETPKGLVLMRIPSFWACSATKEEVMQEIRQESQIKDLGPGNRELVPKYMIQGAYGGASGGVSLIYEHLAGMPKLEEVREAFSKGPLEKIPVLVVQNEGCIGCPAGDIETQDGKLEAQDFGHMIRCAEQMSDALHGEFVRVKSRKDFSHVLKDWMRRHFGADAPEPGIVL